METLNQRTFENLFCLQNGLVAICQFSQHISIFNLINLTFLSQIEQLEETQESQTI